MELAMRDITSGYIRKKTVNLGIGSYLREIQVEFDLGVGISI
jgi:hypothetical protein